jgi:hypothetical protein
MNSTSITIPLRWLAFASSHRKRDKACTSNTEILERFQSKVLRMIVDAPWYVPNTVIRRHLQIPTVKEEIHRFSFQYCDRFSA